MKAQQKPEIEKTVQMTVMHSRLGKKTIEAEHVDKYYGDKAVVTDFSYTILREDRIGIVGKNGAGKTTLLKLLAGQIQPGDIIVAGKNFGCGSSREQAPEIIKALGVRCVVAKSFARIFFRNAINNGLLLIENPDLHDTVAEGDTVEVTVNEGILHNGTTYPIASLPQNLVEIIEAGGLVKAMRKRNGLE